MESKKVSKRLLMRLPVYLNYLKSLPEDKIYVSATQMANALGLGDVLVRKDLAKVSSGGRRKVGYRCENLLLDIENFLELNSAANAIIIGVGRLGQALLSYQGFEISGLNVMAGFDLNPEAKQSDKPVYPMTELENYIQTNQIRIGILTVPGECAQEVCNRLISCGIKAIWNFAPVHLNVPENIIVQSENLAISLTALRMRLNNGDKEKTAES